MNTLYENQRTMRQKRRAALQRGVVAILDVGTSKIVCMILQFDPSVQVNASEGIGAIANHGSFRVIGVAKTRSRGVKLGEITKMEERSALLELLFRAHKKWQIFE